MRKLITLAFVLVAVMASAQTGGVKVGIPALANGQLRLGYEHYLGNGNSLELTFGTLFPRPLPTALYDISDIENYDESVTALNELRGATIGLEYKMYSGDEQRGFYFSPYLKYTDYNVDFNAVVTDYLLSTEEYQEIADEHPELVEYIDGNEIDVTAEMQNSFGQLGLGLQIGSHFRLGERLSLDCTWIGLGVVRNSVSADIRSLNVPVDYSQWEQEVQSSLESFDDIPLGFDYELSATDNSISMDASTLGPDLRLLHIRLGYTF